MAATDTITLILKMLQQMEARNRQMEEQRRADDERIEEMEEQRRTDLQTAEERSRHDMQKMLQELRIGRTLTSTRPSTEHFPSLKIDFKEFSGEPEDWNTLFRVHQGQLSALGCA